MQNYENLSKVFFGDKFDSEAITAARHKFLLDNSPFIIIICQNSFLKKNFFNYEI